MGSIYEVYFLRNKELKTIFKNKEKAHCMSSTVAHTSAQAFVNQDCQTMVGLKHNALCSLMLLKRTGAKGATPKTKACRKLVPFSPKNKKVEYQLAVSPVIHLQQQLY